MHSSPPSTRKLPLARKPHWRERWLLLTTIVLGSLTIWIVWSETHPEQEGWLRNHAHDQLSSWFPEAMEPPRGAVGLFDGTDVLQASETAVNVVLVHGLDEPGGLFDELTPALEQAGFRAVEFRYPNDQAITRSSEFLAELNQRPWPSSMPIRVLGGQLSEPSSNMQAGMAELAQATGDADWSQRFRDWFDGPIEGLGDGVVPVDSLAIRGAPEPEIVQATHRGLLLSGPFNDGQPPAIDWSVAWTTRILQ